MCQGLSNNFESIALNCLTRHHLQQSHLVEVFAYHGVHYNLEHNLNIGCISSCGEVRVDHFRRIVITQRKLVLDEQSATIHIVIRTCNIQIRVSYMHARARKTHTHTHTHIN